MHRSFAEGPPYLSNHGFRRAQRLRQDDQRDVGGGDARELVGSAHVRDNQVRPQRVHDSLRLGDGSRGRHCKTQLGEYRLAALAAVDIHDHEQDQRGESLLIPGPAAAASVVTAIGAVTFVRNAGHSEKAYDCTHGSTRMENRHTTVVTHGLTPAALRHTRTGRRRKQSAAACSVNAQRVRSAATCAKVVLNHFRTAHRRFPDSVTGVGQRKVDNRMLSR